MTNSGLVLFESDAPAWLPTGSRAQVISIATPPRPMCLVRLLLRRGDGVFCIPRDGSGKLDLPTRPVRDADPDGALTIAELAEDITGIAATTSFVGAVRNIVRVPSDDYAWPLPDAYFGV